MTDPIEKYIALAEKCGAEVGRHNGEMVWMKFHSQSSVEAFATGLVMFAAMRQPAATAEPAQQDMKQKNAGERFLDEWERFESTQQDTNTAAEPTDEQIDEAGYTLLSELSGIDTYDINLRDQPAAYEALDRYRAAIAANQKGAVDGLEQA